MTDKPGDNDKREDIEELEPATQDVHPPKIKPEVIQNLQVQMLAAPPTLKRYHEAAQSLLKVARHGWEYPLKEIEKTVGAKFGTARFGFAFGAINEYFGFFGYHLTMAGTDGKAVRVEPRERAAKIIKNYQRDAQRALRKAFRLGTSTMAYFQGEMDADEKRRLEQQIALAGFKYALVARLR